MDKKLFVKNITYYDIGKLIGATLIFFFGIIIGVKQVGEPATMIQEDFFAEDVGGVSYEEIREDEHDVAEINNHARKFLTLCAIHQNWCDKIVWSGHITDTEKLSYTTQYFSIFDFLDSNLMKGNDITEAFKILIINSYAGNRRGGATRKRITINLDSFTDINEFWGVLTHEFGHIVDLGVLQGRSKTYDKNYTEFGKIKFEIDDPSIEYYKYSWLSEDIRNEKAEKKDFCSGYGMSNPFEDFAECHNLYLNNKTLFRTMALESDIMKNKYNYFANLFNNNVLRDEKTKHQYYERRPWDTTVL